MQRPTSLLEAEVLIAKQLASKPDDPFWLDAQARADLMDDRSSSALAALERAHRYAPQNENIAADLASAYFLRAEELKRAEDYGRAVELLGEVVSKDPANPIAWFNLAICSERLFLYHQAAEDWRRYLELDPASKWAEESRRHLTDLEEKINQQRDSSVNSLVEPAAFLEKVDGNDEGLVEQLDRRVEQYFELAVREWIPQAFKLGRNADVSGRASDHLAQILTTRHGDHWLFDFLWELRSKPRSQSGLAYLADSVRANQTADLEHPFG